jgi:exonuclease SbcD
LQGRNREDRLGRTKNKEVGVISFVHAADLHLDSPFVGLGDVDEEVAELLRNATFGAFDNVIALCIQRSVDFLLVAGDVYDGADRSLRAQLAFRDGLRKLSDAGIRSFVVHGNHDPLDGWASSLEWPKEVRIFGGAGVETAVFDRGGEACAIIHGISFPQRQVKSNLARKFESSDSAAIQIGLLHCNAGNNPGHENYAPCSIQDLVDAGMDYWALGHVHTRTVLSAEGPVAGYPGNTQGRHINETGPRGCFLVQIDDDRQATVEFIPVDTVRWIGASVDVSPIDTDEELLTVLEEKIITVQEASEGRPCICRLTVNGRGPLHKTLRRAGYQEDLLQTIRETGRGLAPLVWVDRIDVQTRPAIDLEARRRSEDIVGDLLRLVAACKENPASSGALQEHLKTLYDHPTARRHLEMPDTQELVVLLEEAESLCLDKLLVEEDL